MTLPGNYQASIASKNDLLKTSKEGTSRELSNNSTDGLNILKNC